MQDFIGLLFLVALALFVVGFVRNRINNIEPVEEVSTEQIENDLENKNE